MAGRKRDQSLDAVILDATLAVVAEVGYDGMTIDTVAARANCARATVYRRWPTKAELVIDAIGAMAAADTGTDVLPDTGTLRGDMVAMIRPFDDAEQHLRMQAVAALMTLTRGDEKIAQAARSAGVGPWIAAGRALIERAVDRGEFPPPGDIDALSRVIPMLCVARAIQREPITRAFCEAQIDGVILPALRGG